jgi:hypothetical protein
MRRPGPARMLSMFMIGLGTAMIVQTIRAGAGVSLATGYIVGLGLIMAGLLRLYIMREANRNEGSE